MSIPTRSCSGAVAPDAVRWGSRTERDDVGTVDADAPRTPGSCSSRARTRTLRVLHHYTSVKSRSPNRSARISRFSWLDLRRQADAGGPVEAASSDEYFASRPRPSQIGAWASPQSEVIADRPELERLVAAVEERFAGSDVPRPPHWGGWLLAPEVFEFWQGRPSRLHDRLRYDLVDATWQIARLAP